MLRNWLSPIFGADKMKNTTPSLKVYNFLTNIGIYVWPFLWEFVKTRENSTSYGTNIVSIWSLFRKLWFDNVLKKLATGYIFFQLVSFKMKYEAYDRLLVLALVRKYHKIIILSINIFNWIVYI